jgi:FKBP-type peptidyl-prolyl cis-trans isomerase 2
MPRAWCWTTGCESFIKPGGAIRASGAIVKKGDFIEIEYTGKITLTGEVFDETKGEPAFVAVGQKMVVAGVEKQLEEMSIGDEREFKVSPLEAFGKRHPELVRVLPMRDFIKQNINPVPGVFVTIDNRQAKIQSVSGGRVRVDFNHPLAGRELEYRMKVVRQLSEPAEMAEKYLKFFGFNVKCSFSEGKLTIKAPEKLKNLIEKMFAAKLKDSVPAIKEVIYEIEKEDKKADAKSTDDSGKTQNKTTL